jgi:hypothetical protein
MSIPAGQTQRAMLAGTQAYLVVATAPVNMRPAGGDFSQYSQGTGIAASNAFQNVEIQNFQTYPVVISLWVGWDSFIDNRLIIANPQSANIVFPTYPTPLTAAYCNIVDLSGGPFKDINGGQWLALGRVSILISNLTSGTYLLSQYSPSGALLGPSVGIIPPTPLPIRYDIGGNYTVNTGASLNMIISEVYNSIPAM